MEPALVNVPLLSDPLGSIGVVEGSDLLPFEVRRFYFIRDVPARATRGSHAHRELHQFIMAISGSVTVDLDNGTSTRQYELDGPHVGLLIPPGYWRTLHHFAKNTVVAVLASLEYAESDYIRDYQSFLTWSSRA